MMHGSHQTALPPRYRRTDLLADAHAGQVPRIRVVAVNDAGSRIDEDQRCTRRVPVRSLADFGGKFQYHFDIIAFDFHNILPN